jgi:hypothetical protein
MTFLQPFILWALPLVLVPVIIHLINRLRHRRQPWAAMRFLVSATRSSISHARLRQFLVLLFRVLAVLMLILFLSRPLAGGWLGWALSRVPDTVLLLLDRSASMETKIPGTVLTRREQAIQRFIEAANDFQGGSHLVLIDSASRQPQEIANASVLAGLAPTAATDTAADIPAMMQTAVQWLVENRAGTAEIWIASDLQQSNWLPGDSRWKNVTGQIAALPQKVRTRLLSFETDGDGNTAVAMKEIIRRQSGDQGELQFVLDLQRRATAKEKVPLEMKLNGVPSQHEFAMDGQSLRWRHRTGLGAKKENGWGSFTLPADGNLRDNTAYFVYGAETPLRASIVSADAAGGRYFQLAASALGTGSARPTAAVPPAAARAEDWDDSTLILWQGSPPSQTVAEKIRAFARDGGAVVFFPPGTPDAGQFNGVTWGGVETAEADKGFHVLRWDEDQGPLAKTDEGMTLPLARVGFQKRQTLMAAKGVLAVMAAFEDGTPFLARQTIGRGEIYYCSTLPNREWSTLGQGAVLVPMIQRLMQAGSARLQRSANIACGELGPADLAKKWDTVDSTTPKDIRSQAGVYRSGDRLVAVNRPAAEDETETLDAARVRQLFNELPFQMLEERRSRNDALQGEIWRMLLFGMMAFLLVEGLLLLPPRASKVETGPQRRSTPKTAEAAP